MKQKAAILIHFFFLFFILISSASAQTFLPKSIIGKWEGTDSTNAVGNFEFLDSIHLKLFMPGQGSIDCEYFLDTSKNPFWFDIILKNAEKKATLKGLVKFLDNNTLKWQIFLDTERPNSFQKETFDNTIILTRQKKRP